MSLKSSAVKFVFIFLLVFAIVPLAVCDEPAGGVQREPYKIGVEDELIINVWKEDDVSRKVWVRPDGRITIPLVGEVSAEGKTTTELTEILTDKLKEYFTDPIVTVTLLETNSYAVYLLGKVKAPGYMRLRSPKTLLQIISMAGGFEEFADTDNIAIMRRQDDKTIKIPVDFDEIISKKSKASDLLLQRGDVVIIP